MNNEQFEVLKTASDYIVKLEEGIKRAVEFFQNGEKEKGSEMVVYIVEGLQWITDAGRLTEEVQKDKIDCNQMLDKLNEIIEGFENEDYVLIGDLFEYEILPILGEWREKINMNFAQ